MFGSEKSERKKIRRKNENKEKVKKININFFTYSVIYGKFKGGGEEIHFLLVNKKRSRGKMEEKQNQQFILDGYQFVE